MPSIKVPHDYSYVLAAATSTAFLNIYQMSNTARYRKAAGVPYPYAYAEKSEAVANPAAHKFNCAQRAHQNTLEHAPYIIMSMLIAGLKHPYAAAGLGGTWVLGRFLYTVGYSTGEPGNRNKSGGLLHVLGMLGLHLTAAYTVFEFIKEGL